MENRRPAKRASEGIGNCPPVWQYILIMDAELRGLIMGVMRLWHDPDRGALIMGQMLGLTEGLDAIGGYHSEEELEPIAKFLDELLDGWRLLLKIEGTLKKGEVGWTSRPPGSTPDFEALIDIAVEQAATLREILEVLTGWKE